MPRPKIDFQKYIKRIPDHTTELSDESRRPLPHFRRSSNDSWNLLLYAERNWAGEGTYAAPSERHFHRLATMVLLSLVEAFERFLKETAAECISNASVLVPDDRLDIFHPKGSQIAGHFDARSIGRALCESSSWCDCSETNARYRKILADPFIAGDFYVFPQPTQNPAALRDLLDPMSVIWQIRHTIAHNMGVITTSDKLKFQLLVKAPVKAPRLLWPTKGDVWYVKLFLDDAAELINTNVALRLGDLLTKIALGNTGLFSADDKAQELADIFQTPFTIDGHNKTPT